MRVFSGFVFWSIKGQTLGWRRGSAGALLGVAILSVLALVS